MARPEEAETEARVGGRRGCNLLLLALLALALLVFGIAAFVSMPGGAPDPADTGVVPTAPS